MTPATKTIKVGTITIKVLPLVLTQPPANPYGLETLINFLSGSGESLVCPASHLRHPHPLQNGAQRGASPLIVVSLGSEIRYKMAPNVGLVPD